MKSLSRISTIFIVFTFVFALENNSTISGENTDVNNTDSNMQAIDSEVLPIDIDAIKEVRIAKGLRDKKAAASTLKKHQSIAKNHDMMIQNREAEKKKKNILQKWSRNIREKLSVVTLKQDGVKKAIKLPPTPESN